MTETAQAHEIPEDAQKHLDKVDVGPPPGETQGAPAETTPAAANEDWHRQAEQYTNMGADMVQGIVNAKFGRTVVEYGPKSRGDVANALAPVVEKYKGVMPEWLKKWWPELFLAWTLAPIAYGTTRAIIDASRAPAPQPEKAAHEATG